MWQPGWSEGTNNESNRTDGVDWGLAAQQWIQYKESYEQWIQQQYQQHLQMVANAHAAAISSIDPGIINNPPPPPAETEDECKSLPVTSSDAQLSNSTSSKSKSSLKSRFSNSSLLKAAAVAVANSSEDNSTNESSINKTKPLFAAYDSAKMNCDLTNVTNSNLDLISANANLENMTEKSQKQLPLWLRDELEKINKKKQEVPKNETKLNTKTIFSNEDDEEEEQEKEDLLKFTKRSNLKNLNTIDVDSHLKKDKNSLKHNENLKLDLNEDEKEELTISLLKAWMTDILLDVTNQFMKTIAKEVVQYEKSIKIKQELKKSSKSLNITYGEDEDENESDDNVENQEENIDFLKGRAEKKLKEYEAKFSEMYRKELNEEEKKSSVKKFRYSRSKSRTRRKRSISGSKRYHRNRWSRSRSRSYSRSRIRSPRGDKDRRKHYDDYSSDESKKYSKRHKSKSTSRTRRNSREKKRSRSKSYSRTNKKSSTYKKSNHKIRNSRSSSRSKNKYSDNKRKSSSLSRSSSSDRSMDGKKLSISKYN